MLTLEELKQYQDKLDALTQKTRDGCWWYLGTKDKDGRGVIKLGKKMKNVQTMVWELSSGEKLPEGFVVKTSCENRICVRYSHMELGRKTYGWRI
jgi:hypothetical protein